MLHKTSILSYLALIEEIADLTELKSCKSHGIEIFSGDEVSAFSKSSALEALSDGRFSNKTLLAHCRTAVLATINHVPVVCTASDANRFTF